MLTRTLVEFSDDQVSFEFSLQCIKDGRPLCHSPGEERRYPDLRAGRGIDMLSPAIKSIRENDRSILLGMSG